MNNQKPKTVQIPYEVFIALVKHFEILDVENHAECDPKAIEAIREALRGKLNRSVAREEYGKEVAAKMNKF